MAKQPNHELSQARREKQPVRRAPITESEQVRQPDMLEIGGPKGLEPTRYGDWEKAGRCIDF